MVRFASDDGDQYLWFGVNIATAKILTFFPLEGNSNNANEINYPQKNEKCVLNCTTSFRINFVLDSIANSRPATVSSRVRAAVRNALTSKNTETARWRKHFLIFH